MDLTWPCRLVVVGGSCSGKSTLVRNLIISRCLGVDKKDLNIIVASPILASLKQRLWKDLLHRDFKIRCHLLGRHSTKPTPTVSSLKDTARPKLLLVVDDLDQITDIPGGKGWLMDVFGTESHHADMSVILISHHLRIGVPAVMTSADAVVICSMPTYMLSQTCNALGLTSEEVSKANRTLCDPSGLLARSAVNGSKYRPAFNHVVVWRKPLFVKAADGALEPAPTLFTFNFDIHRTHNLESIQ